MTISVKDQITCVRRELAMRRNVYPKWVASGRMKQSEADKELAAMQAVHDSLMAIAATTSQGTFDEPAVRKAVSFELAELLVANRPAQGAML